MIYIIVVMYTIRYITIKHRKCRDGDVHPLQLAKHLVSNLKQRSSDHTLFSLQR